MNPMNPAPLTVYSPTLSSRKTCYVYLPPSYKHTEDQLYPVVYVLHGMNGGETDWMVKGCIQETAERLMVDGELAESIIVMPSDGGYLQGTFYIDWFDGSGKFEQYFTQDLVPFIDAHFRTIKSRAGRLICGQSMGGYGAFILALRNPDLFAAAASISGAIGMLTPGKQAEEFYRLIGPVEGSYAKEHSIYMLSQSRINEELYPGLYFNCGTEDYLYEGSLSFKQHLENIGYPFKYQEFNGVHDWVYFKEHIKEVLQFFGRYFHKID